MEVKRNINGEDIVIQLTPEERREAYLEQENIYDIEDAENYINELSEMASSADYLDYGMCYEEAMKLSAEIAAQERNQITKYDMHWTDALAEATRIVFRNNRKDRPAEIIELMRLAEDYSMSLQPLQYIDKDHQNSLWYGGTVARITQDNILLEVKACGDVIAELYDKSPADDTTSELLCYVKDKSNHGIFHEKMAHYLKNDNALQEAVNSNHLIVHSGNWFEWIATDLKTNKPIGPDALDNVFDDDNILDVLNPNLLVDIFEYLKEYDVVE